MGGEHDRERQILDSLHELEAAAPELAARLRIELLEQVHVDPARPDPALGAQQEPPRPFDRHVSDRRVQSLVERKLQPGEVGFARDILDPYRLAALPRSPRQTFSASQRIIGSVSVKRAY